jgi:TonB family protein
MGSTAFSTVTHGALIAAALSSTGHVATAVHETRAAVAEPIVYVQPRARQPRIAFRRAGELPDPGAKSEKETAPKLPDLGALNDAIDQALSTPEVALEPDLNPMMMAWLTQPDALSTRGTSSTELVMARTALERPPSGIYSPDMVEVSVAPKRGNPLPRYPTALRDMGIEGAFVVRFVVDSTGRVPDDKIDFPSTMHQLFADAVRTALHHSRYVPALVGGRPVTELVVQEFRFVMRKR